MNASRDSAQVTGNPKLSARPWCFWEVNYWKLLAAFCAACPKTLPYRCPQIADSMGVEICECRCPQTDVFGPQSEPEAQEQWLGIGQRFCVFSDPANDGREIRVRQIPIEDKQ